MCRENKLLISKTHFEKIVSPSRLIPCSFDIYNCPLTNELLRDLVGGTNQLLGAKMSLILGEISIGTNNVSFGLNGLI